MIAQSRGENLRVDSALNYRMEEAMRSIRDMIMVMCSGVVLGLRSHGWLWRRQAPRPSNSRAIGKTARRTKRFLLKNAAVKNSSETNSFPPWFASIKEVWP